MRRFVERHSTTAKDHSVSRWYTFVEDLSAPYGTLSVYISSEWTIFLLDLSSMLVIQPENAQETLTHLEKLLNERANPPTTNGLSHSPNLLHEHMESLKTKLSLVSSCRSFQEILSTRFISSSQKFGVYSCSSRCEYVKKNWNNCKQRIWYASDVYFLRIERIFFSSRPLA